MSLVSIPNIYTSLLAIYFIWHFQRHVLLESRKYLALLFGSIVILLDPKEKRIHVREVS